MTSPAPRRRGDQGGYALPMFAITLTVLLAFAGLGVDVWNWWYQAQKMQRAADAAALAGVVYMPSDLSSARTTARDIALANGYPSSQVDVVQGSRANRLDVTVNGVVDNHFVSLLGLDNTTISRDAEAEYTGVVETGSPINQMGNQPIGPGDTGWDGASSETEATNPQVWAQIAGSNNSKRNGDRYTAGTCNSPDFSCSGTTNSEYTSDGYYYTIRLDVTSSDLSKYLLVEVYDGAFVQQGDNCTQYDPSVGAGTGANVTIAGNLAALGDRYNNAAPHNNTYCTGDHHIAGGTYGSGYVTTQFRTAGPDATPWNYTDNFSNNPISACNGTDTTVTSYPDVINRLRPYGTAGGETAANLASQISTPNSYAQNVFHRWTRVCAVTLSSMGITTAGEYDLSFNTRIAASGTAGHNRYAIRAGLGTAANSTTGISGSVVSVFASGPMPLYQNATSSTASFYMARVLPGSVNRVLNLEFFDTGDGSGSGTITILPPPEYASSFSGCTATSSGSPAPTISSGCALQGVQANGTYQGQRIQVRVPIPNNYTCNVSDATGCWVRVRFNWSSGVQDTTTWRASIIGDPVRLTE